MLCCNIFKVSVIVQNKPFDVCLLLLLLLLRTALDCEMDRTEKGGAHERTPIWSEFDPIFQKNLSSGTTSAIGPKRENDEVYAICQAGAMFAIGAKRENEEVGVMFVIGEKRENDSKMKDS